MDEDTAYGRLCALILRVADGQPLSHRWLAAQIGCSASRIPLFLRRMEQAGLIARAPYKNTHTIRALPPERSPLPPERSGVIVHPAPLNDQGVPLNDHPERSGGTPERSPLNVQGGGAIYGNQEVLSSIALANSSSSSACADEAAPDATWDDVHAALADELKRVPLRDFQQRGLSPGVVLAEWAVMLTRPDLAPPARGKVFVKALLNGERIYRADDPPRPEMSHAPAAPAPGRSARAPADPTARSAARRPPAAPIDAAAIRANVTPISRDDW